MRLKEAFDQAHVRSSIYRKSHPCALYAKNHNVSIWSRVPEKDIEAEDWMEWDPNDGPPPCIAEKEDLLGELEAERERSERLLADLRKYGVHSEDCRSVLGRPTKLANGTWDFEDCDCGFDDALNEMEAKP